MQIVASSRMDDDTLAAVAAALTALLEEEVEEVRVEAAAPTPAWRIAAVASGQGLGVARGMQSGWSQADRSGHAARWSAGMHGGFD